jgi:hypothetical protein
MARVLRRVPSDFIPRLAWALISVLVLYVPVASQAAPACGLSAPEHCLNTNELAWSPGFQEAVRRFVGRGVGGLNGNKNAGVSVARALGGPPDDPLRLPDGGWLFSACEAHDCPIKGALVLDPDHRIRAAALFDFGCDAGPCANEPRLDLFLRDTGDHDATSILKAWAERTIAADLKAFPTAAVQRLSGVAVFRAAARPPPPRHRA